MMYTTFIKNHKFILFNKGMLGQLRNDKKALQYQNSLDLHGAKIDIVDDILNKYIKYININNIYKAQIITGKGKGIMFEYVKEYIINNSQKYKILYAIIPCCMSYIIISISKHTNNIDSNVYNYDDFSKKYE